MSITECANEDDEETVAKESKKQGCENSRNEVQSGGSFVYSDGTKKISDSGSKVGQDFKDDLKDLKAKFETILAIED